MFCRECSQSISEKDKFCEKCGAKTSRGEAVQPSIVTPSASAPATPASQQPLLTSSANRFLPFIGLVAGILALVAVFSPWTGMRAPSAGISAEATAWDLVINAKIMGEELGREAWAFIALSGAVIVTPTSLFAMATTKSKSPWGLLGMIVGGLLLTASAIWALSDIDTGTMQGMTVSYGFGLYLALTGGIVASVVGITGLLFDADKRRALTDIPNEWFRSLKDKAMGTERGSETVAAHLEAEREKHCPTCGVTLPENVKFCSECGAKMLDYAPKLAASVERERSCDNCGCAVSVNHRVCIYCGADVKLTPDAPKSDTWNWRESKFYHWLRDVWGT